MFKQSIKANILTIFLLLMTLISLLILSSQYYFNRQLAINSTEETFKHLSTNTQNHLANISKRLQSTLLSNQTNKHFKTKIQFDKMHPIFNNFTQIMSINQSIYSMYFTDEDSLFYQVINIKSDSGSHKLYKAPKNTIWTTICSIKDNTQYSFYDKNKNLISKYTKIKDFDAHSRPWYKKAIQSDIPVRTEPYQFSSTKQKGITFAINLKSIKGVLAMDYTMTQLSKLLRSQKANKDLNLFIFNGEDANIHISSMDGHSVVAKEFMQQFKESNIKQIIKYTKDKKRYFAIFAPLADAPLFLGITLDVDDLFKPHIENIKYSISLSLLFLLLSIPVIFYATSIIVRPIRALIKENQKIKNRNFKDVKGINTHIIEFKELSSSFVLMSKSIQDYQKAQEELLDSIVKLIAEAIDAKSPYTAGHCKRVPEIAQMLLSKASDIDNGIFKEFKFDNVDDLKEFEIGAWLHDCGKVTTPEYVVDKSTKLETINDRIHEIRTRFEVLWRDAQITYMQSLLDGQDKEKALNTLHVEQEKLQDDFAFIANANIGGEFMSEDKQQRIKEIAQVSWMRNFDDSLGLGQIEKLRYEDNTDATLPVRENLLCDKKQHIIKREHFDYASYERDGFKEEVPEHLYNYGEVYNLCIAKGTLSAEERYKINEHIIMSIKMLEKIPFPSHLRKIPEYAGTHHETLIGTGYPRKLSKEDLSIPARIMAIADIFEALTASDRPYKKAKTLSESIKIMSFMVKDEHIDEDLFKLFLSSGLHVEYAKKYLKPEQIDEVDTEQYL